MYMYTYMDMYTSALTYRRTKNVHVIDVTTDRYTDMQTYTKTVGDYRHAVCE